MTNVEKVYRSVVLQMSEKESDYFNGAYLYDKNIGLTRRQWSYGLRSNVKNGRFSRQEIELCEDGKVAWLHKRMYRLVRTERYVELMNEDIPLKIGEKLIYVNNGVNYLQLSWLNPAISTYLADEIKINSRKVITEAVYQELKQKEHHETLPSYVTKVEPEDELKVGDYVRLGFDFEHNHRKKLYSEIVRITYIKGDYMGCKLGIYHYGSIPVKAIKKIIDLTENFKINAGEHTEDIQKILFELGKRNKVGVRVDECSTGLLHVKGEVLSVYPDGLKQYYDKELDLELTIPKFYEHVGLEVPIKEGIISDDKTLTNEQIREKPVPSHDVIISPYTELDVGEYATNEDESANKLLALERIIISRRHIVIKKFKKCLKNNKKIPQNLTDECNCLIELIKIL